jgi:hypothetical protein
MPLCINNAHAAADLDIRMLEKTKESTLSHLPHPGRNFGQLRHFVDRLVPQHLLHFLTLCRLDVGSRSVELTRSAINGVNAGMQTYSTISLSVRN